MFVSRKRPYTKTIPQIARQAVPSDLAEMLELLLERGAFVLEGLDHLGDEADLGVHARAGHEALAATVGDQRAHERRVPAIAQGNVVVKHHRRVLVHRHRFPGERCFFDLEVEALEQADVRRHVVPGLEQDDVTDDDFAAADGDLPAVADHLRAGRGHFLQGRERLLGLRLLDDADDRIQHHDHHDGDGVDPFAKQQRNHRSDHQDDDEIVVELVPEQREEPGARPLGKLVCTLRGEPPSRFRLREAVFEVRLEVGGDLGDRLAVGIRVVHLFLLRGGRIATGAATGVHDNNEFTLQVRAWAGTRCAIAPAAALAKRGCSKTAKVSPPSATPSAPAPCNLP